jgi:hypothetical protein
MRAKLDENVPIDAAELLRAASWNCDTVTLGREHRRNCAGAVAERCLARSFALEHGVRSPAPWTAAPLAE